MVLDDLGRELVQEVGSGVGDFLVDPHHFDALLAPIGAACFAAGEDALGSGELLLERAEEARVCDLRAVREDGEVLQADVHAAGLVGLRKFGHFALGEEGDEVLPGRIASYGCRQDAPLYLAALDETDEPELRQLQGGCPSRCYCCSGICSCRTAKGSSSACDFWLDSIASQ